MDATHAVGMAAAQKNAADLLYNGLYEAIGFDFAVVEECGENIEGS